MRHAILFLMLVSLALTPAARAAELWVDASAPAGGDGSAAKPHAAIAAAIKAAKGGDTITIRKGIYRETLALAASGTPEKPTVLRAAPGERVILSGFEPIKGWQPQAGGLYTATVEGPVTDLFVGLQLQPVSRWTDTEQPMRPLTTEKKGTTFKDPAGLADPVLKEVAAAPGSLLAFLYYSGRNTFGSLPVKGLDLAAGTVTLAKPSGLGGGKGKSSDRYQLVNHPRLIAKAGQWAFEDLDGGKVRLTFRPRTPADLAQTQYRRGGRRALLMIGGGGRGPVSNVRIEGLEVCGSIDAGISVQGSSGIAVSGCLIHNCDGTGLAMRRSDHVRFTGNLVLGNGGGMGVTSSHDVLVEKNEVAFNLVDGIDVAGNVTGKPNGEPESFDIVARRNYFHHHLLLSHPDNFQCYRGVHRLTIEDNLLLWGGQALMTEEIDHSVVRNCIAVGTGAVALIFGHSNSWDWTVEHCTVGLGGWGAFSFTAKDYAVHDSIVWNNAMSLPETLKSDYNLFYNNDPEAPIYIVTKPRWRRLTTPAEAAATGHEAHSVRTDPKFRLAPVFQAPATWDDANTASYLKLRAGSGRFEVGDKIEINGDGVLRQVTAATEDSVTFAPPLPGRPFRDALIWNWKKAASTELDLRPAAGSPALTAGRDGKPVGADLDIAAYKRGEFSGAGKREIPALPDDVRAALPDPNVIVLPVYGR